MAALEKVHTCLSCGAEIKLERKPNNSGWIKYNLDGTKHADERKNKKQSVDNGLQLAELTKKVATVESKIDLLIAQI